MDQDQLLALFDAQLRDLDGEPAGAVRRHAGPDGNRIIRSTVTAENADEVIAEQQAYFAGRGPLEWKHYGYDRPADLPARLVAAGFVPEPTETVLVGEAAGLTGAVPAGVEIVPVTDQAGFEAIIEVQEAVHGADWRGKGTALADEYAKDPSAISLFMAVAGGQAVSIAWIRFHPGTDFASLWGGSTRPEWRRRGIYRALVAHRAALAVARGYRYLQVDASDESRPILERLGFVPLTTTTPYVWNG
jgi:GNAT superfamily N-acetyltransferase